MKTLVIILFTVSTLSVGLIATSCSNSGDTYKFGDHDNSQYFTLEDIEDEETEVSVVTDCDPSDVALYIPDANFKNYLVNNSNINTNGDSEIQVSEACAYTGDIHCNRIKISDLTGIEAFTNSTTLICGGNELTSLNVSNNTALTHLYCNDNQLTSLDVSNNSALTYLDCRENQLTSLDVSNNTALLQLHCEENQLASLDVSNNTALLVLSCFNDQLTSNPDLSNNTDLVEFWGPNGKAECNTVHGITRSDCKLCKLRGIIRKKCPPTVCCF